MDDKLEKIRKSNKARAKMKRFKSSLTKQLILYGSILAIILIVYFASFYIKTGIQDTKIAYPPQPLSENKLGYRVGTDIPATGKKNELIVYEDFRCPSCKLFEEAYGDDVNNLIASGRLEVIYYIGSFLDNNLGGSGSITAANSAACAQDQGRFKPYHDLLYKNQPSELEDTFSNKRYLMAIAQEQPGLNLQINKFKTCLDHATYQKWARKVQDQFVSQKIKGTPTFVLNGKEIPLFDYIKDRDKVLKVLNDGHE
jgi:protein-disulfide isomerase